MNKNSILLISLCYIGMLACSDSSKPTPQIKTPQPATKPEATKPSSTPQQVDAPKKTACTQLTVAECSNAAKFLDSSAAGELCFVDKSSGTEKCDKQYKTCGDVGKAVMAKCSVVGIAAEGACFKTAVDGSCIKKHSDCASVNLKDCSDPNATTAVGCFEVRGDCSNDQARRVAECGLLTREDCLNSGMKNPPVVQDGKAPFGCARNEDEGECFAKVDTGKCEDITGDDIEKWCKTPGIQVDGGNCKYSAIMFGKFRKKCENP